MQKDIRKKNSYFYAENDGGFVVRYTSNIKSTCFRYHFEASRGFSHTKLYLSLHLTRQDMTQGQWPEGRLKVGI